MADYLIKGGLVVDGNGSEPMPAEVLIKDGKIDAVISANEVLTHNPIEMIGVETIDASGCIVTPGFVDPHTHYDGQATWDDRLAPSADHGVTTVVMGNCGVGFAPVRPDGRDFLIELMEGVEDIPGSALADGIDWAWESFPEYLDALDNKARSMDVVAQIPHGALRTYVLGQAINFNGPATAEQIQQMAA